MPAGQAEKYCDEEEKMNTEQKTSGKYSSGNVMYEKLSGRALYCMYASGIVTGAVLLIIIGAVNWFWLMPEEIAVGPVSYTHLPDIQAACRASRLLPASVYRTEGICAGSDYHGGRCRPRL